MRSTRPTAVNLFWALERVMTKAREQKKVADIKKATLEEALKMSEEDIQVNRQSAMVRLWESYARLTKVAST